MYTQHYNYRKELDSIHSHINTFRPTVKMDLLRMWRTTNNVYQEMDKELVNCRRKARLSSKYLTLEQELLTLKQSLLKRITWANLLN